MQIATTSPATPAPVQNLAKAAAVVAAPSAGAPAAHTGRSADGDYKVRSAATSQTKDADGDYKPVANVAAATSTSSVMAAVTSLAKGG